MKIVAVVGQKGGSGKSTVAIQLAAEWVQRGHRVLLVDGDKQGTARTWGEMAASPRPTVVSMGATLHEADQLPALSKAYDWAVIDCPPSHDDVQRAALMVCHLALIPCGPTAPDIWALADSLALVTRAQRIRPELIAAVVITKKMARTVVGHQARKMLAECGCPVLKAELGYRVSYQEAIAAGKGVTTYAPTSLAATEINSLVDELEPKLTKRTAQKQKPKRRIHAK